MSARLVRLFEITSSTGGYDTKVTIRKTADGDWYCNHHFADTLEGAIEKCLAAAELARARASAWVDAEIENRLTSSRGGK